MNLKAHEMFLKAKFIQWMNVELLKLENGVCECKLKVRADFLQQDGFVHAGIITTLADHSAGGAAGTLLQENEKVLTIEFKTNFLRAAKSPELFCKSICLKKGQSIAVAESSIYPNANFDDQEIIAKTTVTLAVLKS